MKLFIVLACIVAVSVAEKQSKNPICSKELTVKPTDCCPSMPYLKESFDKCSANCNQASSTASEKRGKGKSGNKQFFKCVMPCVIENAGILGADGNISSELLTQQMLNGAADEWTSIVPTVVSSCFANATAMAAQHKGKSERKSSSGKSCNKFNKMIMKCVFKNIYLACPAPVDSADCKDLTEKMSQCSCEHEGRAGKKGKGKGKGKGKQTEAPAAEA